AEKRQEVSARPSQTTSILPVFPAVIENHGQKQNQERPGRVPEIGEPKRPLITGVELGFQAEESGERVHRQTPVAYAPGSPRVRSFSGQSAQQAAFPLPVTQTRPRGTSRHIP